MDKQKRFYLVLPLLVIPFLTMAFWALGGGSGTAETAAYAKGLDTGLPEAAFNEKDKTDKLSVYQAAQRDSNRDGISPAFLRSLGMEPSRPATADTVQNADEQASQLQARLAQLHRQVSQPQEAPPAESYAAAEPAQVMRINKLMQKAGSRAHFEDPELKQLDRMLDKIQQIQNPRTTEPASTTAAPAKPFRAIPAVVDGRQKVADGAAVQFKLTDTATIKGILLQRGQALFGTCQVVNQRLLVTIKNIRISEQIVPVNLTVFSMDGMPGIPAPEAELSGVTTSNADQALQNMQLLSMDQSLGSQAAASGINAAKDLFSKKVKKIKVKLQDEYPILLKINR